MRAIELAIDAELAAGRHAEVVARLERRGIEWAANEVPAAGLRQLFIEDPNGVKVEINVKEPS